MSIRKIVSGGLCACIALSLLAAPVGAAGYKLTLPEGYESPFSDVKETDWYYSYVSALHSMGTVSGYDDGRFGPNDTLSSGDALIMVLEAVGSEYIEPTDTHYASGFAQYAVDHGYLTWGEIGELNKPINRQTVAKLAAMALGLEPSEEESPFADVEDGYLTTLYEYGIVSGSEEDGQRVFLPENNITRGEISAIVWQINRVATYGWQIPFMGAYYDVLEDVAKNEYDPDGFVMGEDGLLTYQDDDYRVESGLDVSEFQGEIDWEAVADSGIDFVMIRAGYRGYGMEGNIRTDARFEQNIQGALDAGLDVGVYFFSQAITEEEAEEEAEYLLELIAPYDITYPVVLDWERQNYAGSRTQVVPDADTLADIANAFCTKIKRSGYEPMIYLYQYLGYVYHDLSQIDQWDFWMAEYTDVPTFYYHFDMLQYTNKGTIPGIDDEGDLNIRIIPLSQESQGSQDIH